MNRAVRTAAGLLPVLFFGWMYGTALLLLLGLLNQVAWMSYEDHRLTGWYYGAGLIVAFVVPVVGIVLARVLGRAAWTSWFGGALGLSVAALVLVGVAWSVTQAPRFNQPPPASSVEDETRSPYDGCVTISGGRNTCPGG